MVAILLNALVAVVILGAIYFVARYIIREMGLPAPAMVVLNVVFALVALFWLLSILGGYGGRFFVIGV